MDAEKLTKTANDIRILTMKEIGHLGVGHVGGCLSVAEMLAVLYFDKMNIDPKNPKMEGRDRLVLSKGHAGPALYATLALRGFFDTEMLYTLNRLGTNLPSHCDMLRTPGVDMTAGSLGQGISCAAGMAKAVKTKGEDSWVYCILGDGESQEGQVWEASSFASQQGLDRLIVFLDYNKMQIDGTVDQINTLGDPAARWESFGFHCQRVDGHDCAALSKAIDNAKAEKGRPSMIICDTIKGKGVSFVEKLGVSNHNCPVKPEQLEEALKELGEVR